jgi:hypothetical protein
MKLHSSIKLMVMDDCNDGLPMYSVDVPWLKFSCRTCSSGGYRI